MTDQPVARKDIVDFQKPHDSLQRTIDRILARRETESATKDSQFEKLLDWARKVSVKTGVPLENL